MPSERDTADTGIAPVLLEMTIPTYATCIRTVHFRRLTFVRIWFNRLSTSFQVTDSSKILCENANENDS
jgi:hypothetical protein